MNSLSEKINKKLSFIFLLVALTISIIYIYKDTILRFPSHVHAWTQSDRYAIALRYSNENLNFFHPQTYNLRTIDGVTSVDFPLSDFVPGIIMKVFNFREPIVCRSWALLVSIIGLSFLFVFVQKRSKSVGKALLVVFFVFTAPAYTYYQAGFLPSVHSFSAAIIGYCFFFGYLETKKYNQLLIAAAFLGLAALMRLPFVIFIIASALQLAHNEYKRKNINIKLFLPHSLAIGAVLAYFLFNKYLTSKFGTMFLTKLLPISGYDNLTEILSTIHNRWTTQYFSITHYILLLFFVISFIIFKKLKKIENNQLIQQILFQVLISLAGAFAYFVAMGNQFMDHDYYFIDSFFLPIILLLIALLLAFPLNNKKQQFIFIAFSLIASAVLLYETKQVQQDRYTDKPWDITEIYNKKFQKAGALIEELKIPKDAKMMVLDSYTSNIPLIKINRTGYCIMNTLRDSIIKALDYQYDYMIIPRSSLYEIYTTYPEIIKQIKFIGKNGDIAIYKKSSTPIEQKYADLLGISSNACCFTSNNNYENSSIEHWQNISQIDSTFAYEGKNSQRLDQNLEFSATLKGTVKELNIKGREFITIENNYYLKSLSKNTTQLIVSLQDTLGKVYYYKNFNLEKVVKKNNNWSYVLLTTTLPDFYSPNDILGIYTWNAGKQDLYIDNSKINIYKTNGNLYEIFPENFNYYISVNK